MIKRPLRGIALFLAIVVGTITSFTVRADAGEPSKLGIAFILSAGIESAWDGTLIRDIERIAEAKPHGLKISFKYTDPLWGEGAADAMRLFAKTGKFDIIWAHSSYSDQVKALKDEFPEILFVVVGSGNEGLGGNVYWAYKRLHEPAYLLGLMAGRLTKTNTVGVVGQFPSEDVNDEINAFFAGARSVNGAVRQKIAFIESWYDPAKAAEFTNAQIAAGADLTFQLVASFETCEAAKIMCFGNYRDEAERSPDSIVASALLDWTPDLDWIIGEWWAHQTAGKAYAGNTTERWFSMAEGGVGLSGYNQYEARIPAELKAEVSSLQAKIASGEFEVPLDTSTPQSD